MCCGRMVVCFMRTTIGVDKVSDVLLPEAVNQHYKFESLVDKHTIKPRNNCQTLPAPYNRLTHGFKHTLYTMTNIYNPNDSPSPPELRAPQSSLCYSGDNFPSGFKTFRHQHQ